MRLSAITAVILLAGCNQKPAPVVAPPPPSAGQVDLARLQGLDKEPGAWVTTGRDAGKTHYSPLDAINRESVARLGLAWEFRPGTNRGMQATPVVVDGVMYTSGVAGRVYALDAVSGRLLWKFEPPLKLKNARGSCCDIVNRGVAVWKGKVFVGALDARTGNVVWAAQTTDPSKP